MLAVLYRSGCCAGMHECRARRMRRSGCFHRTPTMLADQDDDLDQIAWSDLEPPQASPKGGGQDARSNTRFNRWAQIIETWRAGASLCVLCGF
jgi:hypothetical protein